MTDSTRPLWRKIFEFPLVAMIIAIVLIMLVMGALTYLFSLIPPIANEGLNDIVRGFLGVAVIFALYKLAIRHLGNPKKDDLPLGKALADLPLGLGVGFAIFSVVVGLAAVFGAYRITGWAGFAGFIPIFMQAGVWAGFFEELLLRGIVFRWLEQMLGSWIALAISALIFGFGHAWNPNATFFSSLAIAIEAGILLGAAYMLTRNLWLAIGIHASWNITQGFIFDVPVSGTAVNGMVDATLSGPEWLSGGAFGLEASVIALVVATSAGLWMLWQVRKEGGIVAPMWARSRREQIEG